MRSIPGEGAVFPACGDVVFAITVTLAIGVITCKAIVSFQTICVHTIFDKTIQPPSLFLAGQIIGTEVE
jgi:hypothetical protein